MSAAGLDDGPSAAVTMGQRLRVPTYLRSAAARVVDRAGEATVSTIRSCRAAAALAAQFPEL
jgi:hypothetical protein